MAADILEGGKEYWSILKRFHTYRAENPMMRPIAIKDMQKLKEQFTQLPCVKNRAAGFISRNQKQSHSGSSPNGGPRVA